MASDNGLSYTKTIDIPAIFLSDETKQPIKNCLVCGKDVISSGEPYMIEKVIKNYSGSDLKSTLFEFAICYRCAEETRKSLSKESLQRITRYMMSNVNFEKRKSMFYEQSAFNAHDWISNCIVKGKSREATGEYHLFAQCAGNQIVFDMMPYMISFEAEDEMHELLSKKTKGEMDDFTKRFFDLPPELKDIFKDKPVMVF